MLSVKTSGIALWAGVYIDVVILWGHRMAAEASAHTFSIHNRSTLRRRQ